MQAPGVRPGQGAVRLLVAVLVAAATVLPAGLAGALIPAAAVAAPTPTPADPSGGPVASAPPADPVLRASLALVLDASGSMAETDRSGLRKIDAAKNALRGLIGGLPDDANVGLRVYGGGTGDCNDTRSLVKVGKLDRTGLGSALDGVTPKGETPIGLALQKAAADLPTSGPRTIVLVSDGVATCTPDPCPVAEELVKKGVDLRVDTVGFDVDAASRAQLSCIARVTNGSYYDAANAAALGAQLSRVAVRAFRAYTSRSTPITGTPTSTGAPALKTGEWVDSLKPGETKYYTVTFPKGSTPSVTGTLVRPAGRFGKDVVDRIAVGLETTDGVDCGEESDSVYQTDHVTPVTATASPPQLGVHTWAYPFGQGADRGCGQPGKYALRVERGNETVGGADTLPVELSVLIEPPLTTSDGLPSAATTSLPPSASPEAPPVPDFTTLPSRAPGGTGFTDAGTVRNGVTSDTIRAGEVLFWRVKLEWGQQLAYAFRFERCGRDSSASVNTWVDDPRRVALSPLSPGPSSYSYDGDGTYELTVLRNHTVPVEYRNRENAKDDAAGPTQVAGWYYIVLRMDDDVALAGVNIPIQLAVRVEGKRQHVPDYQQVDGAATREQLFATGGGSDSGDSSSSGGRSLAVTIALVLAGFLALGVAAVVVAVPVMRARR